MVTLLDTAGGVEEVAGTQKITESVAARRRTAAAQAAARHARPALMPTVFVPVRRGEMLTDGEVAARGA